MLIILEGVDGAGKTTLAEALVRELSQQFPDDKVELRHHRQLERDPMAEYEFDYEDYRPGTGRHIICDRHAWGELVYGPLYRDKSKLTSAMFRHVELFLSARGGKTWHVRQSIDVIRARLASRGEDYLETHHIEHVLEQYTVIAGTAGTFAGDVVPSVGSFDAVVEKLISSAAYYEAEASNLNSYVSYIGRRTPSMLLLGEKRGKLPEGLDEYPTTSAFLAWGTSSGSFLMDALPESVWTGVGVANALEEDDLSELIDTLGGPAVVALGRTASDYLLDLDIEHAAVPHPAFVRRFHRKRQTEYGELIASVARSGEVKLSWPQ